MNKTKITLGDLQAQGCELLAECNVCFRHTISPIAPLISRYGPAFRLDEVETKAVCRACGGRKVDCRPAFPKAFGQGVL